MGKWGNYCNDCWEEIPPRFEYCDKHGKIHEKQAYQRYHRKITKGALGLMDRPCTVCKRIFTAQRDRAKYCNRCRKRAYLARRRERTKQKGKMLIVEVRVCPKCNDSFNVQGRARGKAKYCLPCRDILRKEHTKETNEKTRLKKQRIVSREFRYVNQTT